MEFGKQIDKILDKIAAKDPLQYNAICKKLLQIAEDPHRFKPLKAPMQNKRRVRAFGPFVLIYSIVESEKKVIIEDYDHHDNIYQT